MSVFSRSVLHDVEERTVLLCNSINHAYSKMMDFLSASVHVFRILFMQPFWKDDIHFEGGGEFGAIEVSSMPFVHVPDVEDKGVYMRKLLNDMLDVQASINAGIFAAENNASSQEGEVR
jgi:hypothetical protein